MLAPVIRNLFSPTHIINLGVVETQYILLIFSFKKVLFLATSVEWVSCCNIMYSCALLNTIITKRKGQFASCSCRSLPTATLRILMHSSARLTHCVSLSNSFRYIEHSCTTYFWLQHSKFSKWINNQRYKYKHAGFNCVFPLVRKGKLPSCS